MPLATLEPGLELLGPASTPRYEPIETELTAEPVLVLNARKKMIHHVDEPVVEGEKNAALSVEKLKFLVETARPRPSALVFQSVVECDCVALSD